MKLILAAFLAAHALIHVSYLTPAPPRTAGGPEWPFDVTRSWLATSIDLDPALTRTLAAVLVAISVGALLAAAAATLGWLPTSWWAGLVVAGATGSVVVLALFFHPWLLLGIAIDAVLLWATLLGGWSPSALEP